MMLNSPTASFILKIAGACNLNCSYCYMYNLGDTTFNNRPRVMEDEIATLALNRIFDYAIRSNLSRIVISLHGGEPLLVGLRWMKWLFEEIDRLKPPDLDVIMALQTNGVLLNSEWLKFFASRKVRLGISFDGPQKLHDFARVNHGGNGSYAQVAQAIELLVHNPYEPIEWGVLTVANPEFDSLEIFQHFLDLGITNMDFLWPDYHHDMPAQKKNLLSKYYINLFDHWFLAGDNSVHIRWFESIIELLLGGQVRIDSIGPQSISEVVIETDGSLEPLDVLRICRNGMTQLGINVVSSSIDDLRQTKLFQAGLFSQQLLPAGCLQCPIYKVCGGGYLPHRWSNEGGFTNPSVHCQDLYNVITHIASSLENAFKYQTSKNLA